MVKEHFDSWVPKVIGTGAITLLPLGIFYRHSQAELETVVGGWAYMRRHEWQHVSQVRRMGTIKFYLTYLWQALKAGFRHDSIPLEQEANAAQNTPYPANCPDHP